MPAAPDADLLLLAFKTFAELGYEGASIRDLTRRLGVSHNLIHSRFGSKDNLWRKAVDHCLGQTTPIYTRIFADPYPSEADRLRALVMNFTHWMALNPHYVQLVTTEGGRESWRLDYLHDNYIMPYHRELDKLLKRIARQHKTRAIDSAAFQILLVHGIGGFYALSPLTQRLMRATKSSGKKANSEAELFASLLLGSVFAERQ
jgi:AcrR family transcriptional regulator